MNSNYRPEQNESLASQIAFKFFPYWPVFLFLFATALAGAYAYLQTATPVYSSSATILIKDEKKGTEDPKMMETLNYFSSKKILENEIEVIHSRRLLTEVIQQLNLLAPTFEKEKYKYTSAYVTSPVTIEVRSTKYNEELRRNGKIPFSYIYNSRQVKINDKKYPLNEWVTTPLGILRFTENKRRIADAAFPLYFSVVSLDEEVAKLSSQITVTPVTKLSTVVRIETEDEVPQRANDILNTLAQVYYTSSINEKSVLAENTLRFIEKRINIVKRDLDSLEGRIQMFKAGQGIVDLGAQGQQFIQNVGSNDQKIADIDMQSAVLDQLERYVIAKDNTFGIVPSTLGVNDPVLISLLEKLYSTETEYEKLKKLSGENNPLLLSLAAQIKQLRLNILENIRNRKLNLRASKTIVKTTNSSYNSVLSRIPQKEKALLELTRQQSIISNVYTFLLEKREETGLSLSPNIADNKIIDTAAASIYPVKPKSIIIYAISLILALAAGITFVLGKENLSGHILYRSELEKLTVFPVIAEIGYEKTKIPLAISEGKNGLIAEQFRKLRATLTHIDNNRDNKKVLITSTFAGEGKSFVAANMGLTLAMGGKKVILLELDLSNPTLSKRLDVRAEKGISSFLRGECIVGDIIKNVPTNSNLFIIPSGNLPNNPSELIINGKVEELLSYLQVRYDYIIVDTAPVTALSDAYILSPLCDHTLYIVRHNHTPKAALKNLDKNNTINELKNVRIVFNSVKPRGFSSNSYGYGYSYGLINNIELKNKKLLHKEKA